MTAWICNICGCAHDELPTCFGVEAPWWTLVSDEEFDSRVELTADQCVVDKQYFFIRGHVEIPIHGWHEPFAFSVWSSLSESSFCDMTDHWDDDGRANLPPYFGWLCNEVPTHSDTLHLPLEVQCREPGLTPLFTIADVDHPLAADQRSGISLAQWHERALKLLSA